MKFARSTVHMQTYLVVYIFWIGSVPARQIIAAGKGLDDVYVDELSVDDLSADDISVGDLYVGDLSVGDLSVDDLSVDYLSIDDLSADDLSVDGISVGDLSVDDVSVDDVSVRREVQLNLKVLRTWYISSITYHYGWAYVIRIRTRDGPESMYPPTFTHQIWFSLLHSPAIYSNIYTYVYQVPGWYSKKRKFGVEDQTITALS